MNTISHFKHIRIPIQVEYIKELQYTIIIYPEHSVVFILEAAGTIYVIVHLSS